MTPSRIDRLGDRLRKGVFTEDDARLLNDYRESFSEAVDAVASAVSPLVHPNDTITKRTAKSTVSIIAKLQREKTRLSTMQDIGGMRIVVSGVIPQKALLDKILTLYPGALVDDKRDAFNKTGYRAIHIIVRNGSQHIEVQIRTRMQNAWAQTSEKLADRYGVGVKYGSGTPRIQDVLLSTAKAIQSHELLEDLAVEVGFAVAHVVNARRQLAIRLPKDLGDDYANVKRNLRGQRNEIEALVRGIANL